MIEKNENPYLQEKFDDAMQDHCLDVVSTCCGAPTSSDIRVCSDCGNHCEVESEEEYSNVDEHKPKENLKEVTDRLCRELKKYILSEHDFKRKIQWFKNYQAYIRKLHHNASVEAREYANNCERDLK